LIFMRQFFFSFLHQFCCFLLLFWKFNWTKNLYSNRFCVIFDFKFAFIGILQITYHKIYFFSGTLKKFQTIFWWILCIAT
jgi:hypothetical protein